MIRRRAIVVFCSRARACRQDAGIESAADRNGCAARHAERQKLVERTLLEERVPAGKEKTVEVAALQRFEAYLPFIHADPDGPNHPLGLQRFERTPGATHRLVEDFGLILSTRKHV